MSTVWLSLSLLCFVAAEPSASPATPPAPAVATVDIDPVIDAACKPLNIAVEAPADDATFLRRVWLDLAGRTPSRDDARKFLASKEPNKRTALIESLLTSKAFANHWGRVWTEYLTDRRPFNEDVYNGIVLRAYLRDAFEANTSYRQVAFDLLQGSGSSEESGPANFLLRYEAQPVKLAGAVSKKFLGLTMHCAECHDHPHAKWMKDEFWGLAAFFGRLRKLNPENDSGFSLVMDRKSGELKVPDMAAKPDENGTFPEKTIFPRLPGSKYPDTTNDRRATLAGWVTSDQNPYFARHAVNRVWLQFFGKPLVATLDKWEDEPASLRKSLLDLLAKDFTASGCDLRRLVRTVVMSAAYQRSSGNLATMEAKAETGDELRFKQLENFARFPVRPLSSDQLYLSIVQATGVRGGEEAARLAETTQQDYITDLPGERFGDMPLSVQRSLSLLNGEYIVEAARVGAETAQRKHGETPGIEHLNWLFLSTLSRSPTPEETNAMLELSATGEEGLVDVVWVVLNSAEFNTNH